MPVLPFEINPLPDFLGDHTLAGENEAQRLREHAMRWVQFVESLWSWCDRATFAIRFHTEGGRTRCYLVAVPDAEQEAPTLAREIATLLRAHRLVRAVRDPAVPAAEFARNTRLASASFLELAQFAPRNLWTPPPLTAKGIDTRAYPGTTDVDWTALARTNDGMRFVGAARGPSWQSYEGMLVGGSIGTSFSRRR